MKKRRLRRNKSEKAEYDERKTSEEIVRQRKTAKKKNSNIKKKTRR